MSELDAVQIPDPVLVCPDCPVFFGGQPVKFSYEAYGRHYVEQHLGLHGQFVAMEGAQTALGRATPVLRQVKVTRARDGSVELYEPDGEDAEGRTVLRRVEGA